MSQGQSWDKPSFHVYTAGRWLFNEHQQLAARCVNFNFDELIKIAQGLDSSVCTKVEKLEENYNKAFLLTMESGHQVVAKVPNPNAGLPFYTTASEVATMEFARTIASIPVPKVHAWNNTADNTVGAEYIIMEKSDGVVLSSQWATMSTDQKHELIQSIITFERSLVAHSFDRIGSIYYENDLVDSEDSYSPTAFPKFVIGPTTDRRFLEDGRRAIKSDKGPSDAKLDVISDFRNVASFILPKDATVTKPVLWHTDLHADNIFVDPNNPSKILAILDWQSAHVAPLCQQVITPAFLDFNGPKPDEGLSFPSLPENFQTLSAEEKAKAEGLQTQQLLYKLYEIQSGRQNKDVFNALQYANTLGCQIIALISQVFNDGETLIKGQLIQLVQQWSATVGKDGTPCPITITEDDIMQQEVDQQKWEAGV
ncbi:Aminoglycoside phosphotransferase [Penicillium griseofulvum]|uniref:Altered inheritance of mitochondria protein 9, mitochondrial n=1 Tax=Penicillium patulum TaxID=5078 RepID=A0A135LV83_PENPA|nr:Aminoglycoside phosphotransferase [Penicillium griseofulvum]KXG52884.1 Aminoglycoside phosphotransferase [Penicillium griseofulvum]